MLAGLDAPIDAFEDHRLALDAQSLNLDDGFAHLATRY